MSFPVHVVIAASGQPDLLRRTLQSLADCDKPAGYCGAIVAENGPRSGLDRVVADFAREHRFSYLYSQPANKSLALNRALERLGGGLAIFTDDDVVVPRGTLTAYARAAAGKAGGEFYGGPIEPEYDGEPPPAWLVPLLPRSAGGWRLSPDQKLEIQQPEFIGPNLAAFVGDVLAAGGFDTRLGPGGHMLSPGEDTEIQARLLSRGIRGYYLPDAAMVHRVRRGAATAEFAIHRAERNGVYWGIAEARRSGFFPRRWLKLRGQWLNDLVRIARWRRLANETSRVRAECLAARWRGRWQGVALGWNWDEHRDADLDPRKQKAA